MAFDAPHPPPSRPFRLGVLPPLPPPRLPRGGRAAVRPLGRDPPGPLRRVELARGDLRDPALRRPALRLHLRRGARRRPPRPRDRRPPRLPEPRHRHLGAARHDRASPRPRRPDPPRHVPRQPRRRALPSPRLPRDRPHRDPHPVRVEGVGHGRARQRPCKRAAARAGRGWARARAAGRRLPERAAGRRHLGRRRRPRQRAIGRRRHALHRLLDRQGRRRDRRAHARRTGSARLRRAGRPLLAGVRRQRQGERDRPRRAEPPGRHPADARGPGARGPPGLGEDGRGGRTAAADSPTRHDDRLPRAHLRLDRRRAGAADRRPPDRALRPGGDLRAAGDDRSLLRHPRVGRAAGRPARAGRAGAGRVPAGARLDRAEGRTAPPGRHPGPAGRLARLDPGRQHGRERPRGRPDVRP